MHKSTGKYSVVVSGKGKASVGDRAKMTVYGVRRRGYATHISSRTTSTITGPGQALKHIPSHVLSQVVESLNLPSPLGNDWKGVAGEMLLPYKTVMSLDHHSSEGRMRGILEIMFEKKFTAGDFVDLLQKIQRPDVIEIFIEAGFPRNSIREKENDEEDSHSSLQEVITTPQISSFTTRSVCARNDKSCDNKKASEDNIHEKCEISNGAVCQHYP